MMLPQLVRFFGVGVLATLVHICTALFANSVIGLESLQSNFLGFAVAVTVSYFGHAQFTFRSRQARPQQFLRFFTVSLTGLLTSSFIVWLMVDHMGQKFEISMACVAVIVPLVTFLAMKFWVFSQQRRTVGLEWISITVALLFIVGFLGLYWSRPHHHDVAWYLVATRKMLEGAVLYADILEINPPLNFYLTVPAILLADVFNLSLTNGQYVFVAGVTAVSIVWSGHILRDEGDLSPAYRGMFLALMAVSMTVTALGNIGQREHMLILLLMPWLVGQMSSGSNRRPILRAVVAAIGICLKPHFIFFPILMLGRDLWREKSLRPVIWPEYLGMLSIGALYVVFVALAHPLYLGEIVPTALVVYGVFGSEFSDVLNALRVPAAIAALLIAMNAFRPAPGSGVLILATIASLMSYVAQGKGFMYHLLPLFYFICLSGIWLVLSIRAPAPVRIISAAAVTLMFEIISLFPFYKNGFRDEIVETARELGATGPLFVASDGLDPGPPAALELDVEWASRYPHQWIYPGALQNRENTDCATDKQICDNIDMILERNRQWMMDDLRTYDPELIAVGKYTITRVTQFTLWTTIMKPHPDYDDFMKRYELVKTTKWFDYYKRRAARGAVD